MVDVDLEKFFDRVNHDVLMGRLAKRIADTRVLGLIRHYLSAGIMADGVVTERLEGTPQGGPLSPLLANVLLDEIDKELEHRGHAFVRYADDCNVYVRSRRAGERVMKALQRLFAKLRLRINESKSAVARPWDRKFLGYTFWVTKEETVNRRIADQALTAMKDRVRSITIRHTDAVSLGSSRSFVGTWSVGRTTSASPRLRGPSATSTAGCVTACARFNSNTGATTARFSASFVHEAFLGTTPGKAREMLAAGGRDRCARPTARCRCALTTALACRGSPRNLDSPNRRMRTRTSGGVAGVAGETRRPYADPCAPAAPRAEREGGEGRGVAELGS